MSIEVAKKFGKETPFAVGMGLLPFVFYPMLGMSYAQYEDGRKAKSRVAA